MSVQPLAIIGAGPAGLVAAITLRRAGYSVKVYEERQDVGLRFHGDFQGIENWSQEEDALDQLRRMGVAVNFLCAPFYSGIIYGPDRERADIRSARPLFYVVRRGVVGDSLAGGDVLNMTRLALNLSEHVNGVAKRHAEVSQRLWVGMLAFQGGGFLMRNGRPEFQRIA